MAAHGYLVYLIRANKPHKARDLYRLSAIDDDKSRDLLPLLEAELKALGEAYHSEEQTSEGYRLKELKRSGRRLWFRINKGPQGAPGEAYDVKTGKTIATTEDQALLSGLRGYMMIPENSFYGLLFVEKVGRRHLKEVINRVAITPVSVAVEAVVRLEAFAEAAEWQKELTGMSALRVSEVLTHTSSADDASTAEETVVHVSATGPGLKLASEGIIGAVLDRVERRESVLATIPKISAMAERRRANKTNKNVNFTVQDEKEYQALVKQVQAGEVLSDDLTSKLKESIPVDRSSATHKRFDVAVGEDKPQRTFTMESDAVPQLTYETAGGLSDTMLRQTWNHHGEQIFALLGAKIDSPQPDFGS